MIFGAHLSTAGGLATAFDRADQEGCEALQIFTKNKGMWAARPLATEEIAAFRARAQRSPVRVVVAHAAYLINIASPTKALREKSAAALRVELDRCEALGIHALVFHTGSHGDTSETEGVRRLAKELDGLHRSTRGYKTHVVVENSAGQGFSVGMRLTSIAELLGRVRDPERLRVCLDTCHLFAAGYELRTEDGYADFAEELDGTFGAAKVFCIHLNDSKKELGSRVDRHEHIGRGLIGARGLGNVVNDPKFRDLPFIFELPPDNGMTRVDLTAARALVRRSRAPSRRAARPARRPARRA
jgi:deoxyribonuclease-4